MNLIMRIICELICFVKKDSIILNYPGYKASKNQVNIDYYRADLHDGIDANLGDYLSEIVVHWMCEKNDINPPLTSCTTSVHKEHTQSNFDICMQ